MQEVKIYGGDYGVTDDGRVISYKKKAADGTPIPRELRGGFAARNRQYRFVFLTINGVSQMQYVHRLVASAFVPNPNHYNEVNHKDGDTFNNRADNLEWVTPSENTKHAYDTGLVKRTTCSICGKTGYLKQTVCAECRHSIVAMLLDDQKTEALACSLEGIDPAYWDKHRDIFERRREGMPITEIARECGCSRQNVSVILRHGLAKAARAVQKEAVGCA